MQVYSIENTPELVSNRILSLFEGRDGALWIGTEDAGLCQMRGGEFHHVAESEHLGQINGIAESSDGAIWTAGDDFIRYFHGKPSRVTPFPAAPDTAVYCVHVDTTGQLWAGTDRGLVAKRGDRFELVKTAVLPNGDDAAAYGIVSDSEAGIWVVSELFVGRLQGSQYQVMLNEDIGAPCVALINHDGDFVFYDRKHGRVDTLTRASNWRRTKDRLSSSRPSNGAVVGCRDLVQDNEGNYWLGSNGTGLIRITEEPFVRVARQAGIESGVNKVITDGADGVWLDAFESRRDVVHWDGEHFEAVAPDLLGDLKFLAGGNRTTAWFASPDYQELIELDLLSQHISKAAPIAPLPFGPVVFDHHGAAWTVLGGALCRRDPELGFTTIATPPPDLSNNRRRLLGFTPDRSLWFVEEGRLGRWTPANEAEAFKFFDLPPQVRAGSVRSLYGAENGDIWLSTYGDGLLRLRNGRFHEIGAKQGLLDLNLGGLLADDTGRLWINSNRGVLVVAIEDLNKTLAGKQAQIRCRVISTGEGNGPTAARTPDGRMWFPTINDLIVVDPKAYTKDDAPPTVRIESVVANNAPADLTNDVVSLGPGGNNLEIQYTAFAYASPEQICFRYRLEGYENSWVEAGARRTAYYTRVPPGDYHFTAQAMNPDGDWSESGDTLSLHIEPHYYQQSWFHAVLGAGILGLVVGAHRLRVHWLTLHASELQAEIHERERAESERRRLETALAEATKFEAIGRLAGGVAHDFNNVLTAVIGRAELLRISLLQSADNRSEHRLNHANEIIRCGKRAARMTAQLLAYSRQQVLRPTVVDANDAIAKLEPMLRSLIPESIELRVNLRAESGWVLIDPSQLEQVVMNLVLNARDASEEHGDAIELVTSLSQPAAALPHGADKPRADGEFVIKVSDKGVGIRDQDLPHIFDPFFTTKSEGKGTGLGLASVHGIVTQSGGEVRVASRGPQQGATFTVRLPACAAPAPGEVGEDDSSEMRAVIVKPVFNATEVSLPTVLFCDDNEAIRRVAKGSLTSKGYTTHVASTPAEARRIAETIDAIDLLITDVLMPDENGPELAEAILKRHPGCNTLFISGYTGHQGNRQQVTDGGAHFLQKPFSPEELVVAASEILTDKSSSPR
ncbi:hybrid sensor histidine kinase/response regulator [Pseudobythopirellula maris]|nr:hybrid sensor histidine kinase/response regulator [Pseudobythopirellula maris]